MSQSCPRPDPAPVLPSTACKRAVSYFRQAGPAPGSHGRTLADIAHPVLMAATFDTLEQRSSARPVRRSSITEDGTPIIYSFKTSANPAHREFRCVVEAGGFAVTTDEQIRRSQNCLDELFGALGWQDARKDTSAALATLLPKRLEAARHWWGGMWIGLDADEDHFRLKTYVNMRQHSPEQRWQMVKILADQLAGQGEIAPHLARLADGELMGVGLAIADDRVSGIRLYFGLDRATPGSIAQIASGFSAEAQAPMYQFANRFTSEFGPFSHQSVAICFDYSISRSGRLASDPARMKLELCAELLPARMRKQVWDWHTAILPGLGLNGHTIQPNIDWARAVFGGTVSKYVSLGLSRSGGCHTTMYAHPLGLRLEDGLLQEIAS